MELVGYLLSLAMGFLLGLLGGGGSVLTVPILVYVLGIDPVLGTAYSLFVVGAASVLGGWRKHTQGQVDWKTGLIFALPSLLAVFLTRYYVIPAIPEQIVQVEDFILTKNMAIMIFFAAIMLFTSYSMLKGRQRHGLANATKKFNPTVIILEGLAVGAITGLIGAGGGFLIVPALVLLMGMPIKKAIGTSLIIIAIKSLIGFLGDVGSGQEIDWKFLLIFTSFAMAGMFLGSHFTKFVRSPKLKKGFGLFLLIMGIFIIGKELAFP